MHNVLGGTIDPHAAFLVSRGLKTLALRVRHVNAAALEIATRLEAHPKIARVHYPGEMRCPLRYAFLGHAMLPDPLVAHPKVARVHHPGGGKRRLLICSAACDNSIHS